MAVMTMTLPEKLMLENQRAIMEALMMLRDVPPYAREALQTQVAKTHVAIGNARIMR
jgi:hypothetical protein